MPEHSITDEMVEAAAGVVAEEFGSEWPVEHESMDPETGAPVYPEEIADIYRSIAREVLTAAGVPSVLESLDRERQRTRAGVKTPPPGFENAYVSGNAHAAVCAERDKRQEAIDTALSWMRNSAYVGGPSERDAWRKALEVLGPFETQHVATALPTRETP